MLSPARHARCQLPRQGAGAGHGLHDRGMAVSLVIVKHRIAEQSEREPRHTLVTANAVIRYSQEYCRTNLLSRFHHLPNEPLWRQFFQVGGGRDLHDALRGLMNMLKVVAAFCAILFSTGVEWFFVNRIAGPLRELRHSAEAAGRGDFTRRVAVHSRDECGEPAPVIFQLNPSP